MHSFVTLRIYLWTSKTLLTSDLWQVLKLVRLDSNCEEILSYIYHEPPGPYQNTSHKFPINDEICVNPVYNDKPDIDGIPQTNLLSLQNLWFLSAF